MLIGLALRLPPFKPKHIGVKANMLFISFLGCFFDIDFHDGLPFLGMLKVTLGLHSQRKR